MNDFLDFLKSTRYMSRTCRIRRDDYIVINLSLYCTFGLKPSIHMQARFLWQISFDGDSVNSRVSIPKFSLEIWEVLLARKVDYLHV